MAGAVYMSADVHEGEEKFIGDRWVYAGNCYLCAEASGIEKLIIKQYVEGESTYHVHLVKAEAFDEADLPPTVASAADYLPIAGRRTVYEFYQWPSKGEDGLASGINDALFIAHARNDAAEADVAELIREVEMLRAQVERLTGQEQDEEQPDIPF